METDDDHAATERKPLFGPEHTLHCLYWRTSCSLVGKCDWKAVGNYAIWFVFWKRTLEWAPGVLSGMGGIIESKSSQGTYSLE